MIEIPCATCGAPPVGTFNDGSPRYATSCTHPPLRPGQAHPAHRAAIARLGVGGAPFVDDHGRLIVPLSPDEAAEGEACGKLRLRRAQARKAKDQLGQPSELSHVTGAMGERAFAKWLGLPWECTTGRYGGASDVAGCQIRTATEPRKRCVVHGSDPGRTPVVSIVRNESRFWIRGWIMAGDAKRAEWIDDPGHRRPAYFVPTPELLPIAVFVDDNRVRAAMRRPPKEVERAVPEASAP